MTESDIFYTLEQVNKHLSYRDYDVIISDISNINRDYNRNCFVNNIIC